MTNKKKIVYRCGRCGTVIRMYEDDKPKPLLPLPKVKDNVSFFGEIIESLGKEISE
jgi:hypothetical protein